MPIDIPISILRGHFPFPSVTVNVFKPTKKAKEVWAAYRRPRRCRIAAAPRSRSRSPSAAAGRAGSRPRPGPASPRSSGRCPRRCRCRRTTPTTAAPAIARVRWFSLFYFASMLDDARIEIRAAASDRCLANKKDRFGKVYIEGGILRRLL